MVTLLLPVGEPALFLPTAIPAGNPIVPVIRPVLDKRVCDMLSNKSGRRMLKENNMLGTALRMLQNKYHVLMYTRGPSELESTEGASAPG